MNPELAKEILVKRHATEDVAVNKFVDVTRSVGTPFWTEKPIPWLANPVEFTFSGFGGKLGRPDRRVRSGGLDPGPRALPEVGGEVLESVDDERGIFDRREGGGKRNPLLLRVRPAPGGISKRYSRSGRSGSFPGQD